MALVLMGLATTLIGCLPGYASIGVAAPLLLIVLRFAQGIAIGGQWGGAVLITTENAPRERAASTAASRRSVRRLASSSPTSHSC